MEFQVPFFSIFNFEEIVILFFICLFAVNNSIFDFQKEKSKDDSKSSGTLNANLTVKKLTCSCFSPIYMVKGVGETMKMIMAPLKHV